MTHNPNQLRYDQTQPWNPSTVAGTTANTTNTSDQYKTCTQCHGFIAPTGQIMASGDLLAPAVAGTFGNNQTTGTGHHNTTWYHVIATTHYTVGNASTNASYTPGSGIAPVATGTGFTGYGLRFSSYTSAAASTNPCYDCHSHNALTNTGTAITDPTQSTIYTDWGKSAHAAGILQVKYSTALANPSVTGAAQVDLIMQASSQWSRTTPNLPSMWSHGGTGGCSECHSPSGFAAFMDTRGAKTPSVGIAAPLSCYGCHTDTGMGTLRALKGTSASTDYVTFKGMSSIVYNGRATHYPDVAGTNGCLVCHAMQGQAGLDPAIPPVSTSSSAIAAQNHTTITAHHGGSIGFTHGASLYVKYGFIGFSTAGRFLNYSSPGNARGLDPAISKPYAATLMANTDNAGGIAGTITSTHRILGTPAAATAEASGVPASLTTNGPCVACHLTGSHSLMIDQKAITAVCNNCHSSENGEDITTISAFDQYFLIPNRTAYNTAIKLAMDIFNSKNTGIVLSYNLGDITNHSFGPTGFVAAYEATNGVINTPYVGATLTDWTHAATVAPYNSSSDALTNRLKLLGAVNNVIWLSSEHAAYVHARTYSRRLLYDSIDYLLNGHLTGNTVGAAAMAMSATAGTQTHGLYPATLPTNAVTPDNQLTTNLSFLLGFNHSTSAWNATERP